MSKGVYLTIGAIVIGSVLLGSVSVETGVRVECLDDYLLTIKYIDNEGDNQRVFIHGPGDQELVIKGEITFLSLLSYGSRPSSVTILRGDEEIWTKYSAKGEVIVYNRDVQ